jgi:hypothetical protein
MDIKEKTLPVRRANELDIQPPEQTWMIRSLWARAAVGIIGGPPKCYKSWLGLDMALSVASASPCLGCFPVHRSGRALIYLAEDAISAVRSRIDALCSHRQLDIDSLDLYVITAPTLRLDLSKDQVRLKATLHDLRPRLLLLDPLIRMHRLDENSAADISNLLGFLREMQRSYDLSIVLVHHANKKHYAQPGKALRGSSDLHAFGDSNAYLAPRNGRMILTIEHRSAKPPHPIEIKLASRPDGSATHLEIASSVKIQADTSLAERTVVLLHHQGKPMPRTAIRKHLKVNNQRLGQTLENLHKQGLIEKTAKGWVNMSFHPSHGLPTQLNTAKSQHSEPQQCSLSL